MQWIDIKQEKPTFVEKVLLMRRFWKGTVMDGGYEAEYSIGEMKRYVATPINNFQIFWSVDGKEIEGHYTHWCRIPNVPQN